MCLAKLGDLLEFGEIGYFLDFLGFVVVLKGGLVAAHKSFFQIRAVCGVLDNVGGAGQYVFGVVITIAQP